MNDVMIDRTNDRMNDRMGDRTSDGTNESPCGAFSTVINISSIIQLNNYVTT